MKKKKLLHIISSLKIGGAESLLVDMIRELDDEFEQHVIYFHPGPNVTRIEHQGIPVYRIRGLVSLYDPLFLKRLYGLVKSIAPNCIHTSLWAANFFGRIIAKFLKIPTLSVVHLGVNQDGFFRNILDRYTFFLATRTVAVSDDVAQTVEKKGFLKRGHIQVIRNGIDVEYLVQHGRRLCYTLAKLGLDKEHVVFGSVGRFIPRKNYTLLLSSFSQVHGLYPEARLVLIGTGPEEGRLRKTADELGIHDLVRFVVGELAYGYFPLFDCFVLSSLQEGLSIALLEAMSFGLAPIVTVAHEKHEVIKSGENGICVPLNDAKSLSLSMGMLVGDGKLRESLGRKAYESVAKDYSMGRMINSYRRVLRAFN